MIFSHFCGGRMSHLLLDFTFCHLLPPVILMGWCSLCTVGVVSIQVGTFMVV